MRIAQLYSTTNHKTFQSYMPALKALTSATAKNRGENQH